MRIGIAHAHDAWPRARRCAQVRVEPPYDVGNAIGQDATSLTHVRKVVRAFPCVLLSPVQAVLRQVLARALWKALSFVPASRHVLLCILRRVKWAARPITPPFCAAFLAFLVGCWRAGKARGCVKVK